MIITFNFVLLFLVLFSSIKGLAHLKTLKLSKFIQFCFFMGFIVFSISEILNVYPMISKVSLSLFVSGFCSICLIQRTRLITKKINQVFWRIPFVIGLSLNLIKDEQLFIQVCYIILALSVLQLLIKPKNISHYVIRHAFKLLGIICITYLLYIFKLESLYIGFALIYLFSLQIINALKLKVVFNEA